MSNPRILQIVHDHPAFTSGGTEWIAHDLTTELRRLGAAARLVAASTSLSRPEAAPGALEAFGEDFLLRTGAYDAFSMTRDDGPTWVASLSRVLADVRPDLVHLHGLDRIGADVVHTIRAHRPRARIVMTLHDYQSICARDGLMVTQDGALCHGATPGRCRTCLPQLSVARHALREARLKSVLSEIDLFIAPSQFLKTRYMAWGLDESRIAIVPNGVPAAQGCPPVRGDRFAFFGNLAEHKGIYVLLDAAARIARRGGTLRIAIHGGFTWAAEAERRRFTEAVERAAPVAHHHGPYDRSDLAGLMAQADWVVVPSTWWENAPLVILEAQRAGRPVICTGIGGMAESVTHGVTGLHVPRGDPAALAETIEAAAADAALCRRLFMNIRPPDDVATMARAHLCHYRRLLEKVPA